MIAEATREKVRARIAILGPTGSGKTATSLLFATTLARHVNARVGVIDSQHHQSRDYVNTRFAPDGFLVEDIQGGHAEAFINATKRFIADGRIGCLVVDGMSDLWQSKGGVLDLAGDNAQFSDWGPAKEGNWTFLDLLQSLPVHVIVTVLADTNYVIRTDDSTGRQKMTSVDIVGTRPIQDKKMMPKFSLQASMDQYHYLTVTRTSFEPFDRARVEKPDGNWLLPYIRWMDEGAVVQDVAIAARVASPEQLREYYALMEKLGYDQTATSIGFFKKYGFRLEDAMDDFLAARLVELRARRPPVTKPATK